MKTAKKNIVILGAGYCGIQAAKRLSTLLNKNSDYEIILVDKSSQHVYVAELYEISAAYYDQMTESCVTELRDALAFPVQLAVAGKNVNFVQDEVENIDTRRHFVSLKKRGMLNYHYLIVALGSETNYYGMKDIAKNAYSLKTVSDALKINCDLDHLFQNRSTKNDHKPIKILVSGGGFTGAELVCELAKFIKKLSKKYQFEMSEVTLKIIQGSNEMIGLGSRVSKMAIKRFKKLGIEYMMNTSVIGYKNNIVEIKNRQTEETSKEKVDMLIWTAGIQTNSLLSKIFKKLDEKNCLQTKTTLECLHYERIYAGGDNASIFDPKNSRPLPKLGQLAIQQGELIAQNIYARINNLPEKKYKPFFKGFILQLGGKYGIYSKGNFSMSGILPWALRKFVDLRYYLAILSPVSAVKKWWKTENIFLHND